MNDILYILHFYIVFFDFDSNSGNILLLELIEHSVVRIDALITSDLKVVGSEAVLYTKFKIFRQPSILL